MDNGCPKCEKLNTMTVDGLYMQRIPPRLCLDCQLEQAEADVLKAMNAVERIKGIKSLDAPQEQ